MFRSKGLSDKCRDIQLQSDGAFKNMVSPGTQLKELMRKLLASLLHRITDLFATNLIECYGALDTPLTASSVIQTAISLRFFSHNYVTSQHESN